MIEFLELLSKQWLLFLIIGCLSSVIVHILICLATYLSKKKIIVATIIVLIALHLGTIFQYSLKISAYLLIVRLFMNFMIL